MAHLELTGVSEDGKRLLLAEPDGSEHVLEIDQRLRSALREQPSRRWEKHVDSTLRPRDIQARIRAGETAEDVAAAAGTAVEKIMAFAGPVLAERQHVAQRAQRSSVRRRAGESAGSARTLGEAVEVHLRTLNVDPRAVEWDAWRREDGRWSLSAAYDAGERSGTAELTFDVPGNFVLLDNDDARWLVGESVAAPAPARDDLQQVRQRRLTTVDPVDQQLPYDDAGDSLGDDAIQLVHDQPAPEAAPEAAPDDDTPTTEQPAVEEPVLEEPPAEEPPARRPVRKSRGRASVPSWDEIMFGGGKQE